jgi:starch synthase
MTGLTVLSVASEIYPLIKTGGLADVTGALPLALAAENIAMHSLVPGYPAVLRGLENAEIVLEIADLFGGSARVLAGQANGLELFALDAAHLYDRPGNPYSGPDGRDWPDNAERFAALAQVGAKIAQGAVSGFSPDIVQAHDWQAGLTLAYLRFNDGKRPRGVITVHNIAFAGQFNSDMLERLHLPPAAFATEGLEFHGDISMLKAGLHWADAITTVSPTYAVEIRDPAAGMGFEGLLQARSAVLHGILNGIDTDVWNPAADVLIAAPFSAGKLAGRTRNKAALQRHFGLSPDPKALLLGVVSRLFEQKGLDLLLDCLPLLKACGAQLVLLGSGDRGLEAEFLGAAQRDPTHVGCVIGYDEGLAHQVQAGADAIVVPSRFEPCGLTQLCALRYGAVPVVARVGGLSDTVIDLNEMARAANVATGIQFAPVSREGLAAALRRAAEAWSDRALWRGMQKRGMATDVSWARPAKAYAALFRTLAAGPAPGLGT